MVVIYLETGAVFQIQDTVPGVYDEIAPNAGKYCKDHYDYKNMCDGTKNDCILKGKEMCESDPNCYGIMYHCYECNIPTYGWASTFKGVKVCTSSTLQEKPEKDWSVFLKCDSSGN